MSRKESISIKYEDTSYKKIYISPYNLIKRKLPAFRISKRINDMKIYVDKIYNNFYTSSTDVKRQKEIEEYIKFKKMEKIRRINFIKNLRQYFKQKKNKEEKVRTKSVKNIYDMRLLYSKVINTILMKNRYKNKIKPYIFQIKKEEFMKLNCITEFGLIDTIKKIKEYNLLKEKGLFSKGKKKRMTIQKLNAIRASTNFNNYFNKKRNTMVVMPRTLNNNNKKIILNFSNEKNNKLISPSPSTRYASAFRRNYNLNTNKINFRINSGITNSSNKNVYQNYTNSSNIKKLTKKMNIKIKSVLDVKKSIIKILPVLSSSFNSTLTKSRELKKQIKFFKRDETMRSESSKRKNQRILKKFFVEHKVPSIRSSLGMTKKNILWAKNKKSKYIHENRNGTINLKFNLMQRVKSPLIFVEDYNKLRNRRRRNNNIEKNLGLRFLSSKKERNKFKRENLFLGMSFNNIRKINT